MSSIRFKARVISGAGRGKNLGVPTLNLDLHDVPKDLQDGVFACFAILDGKKLVATMHNGPRPTFDNSRSCEVHLIDESLPSPPKEVEVEVIEFLRGISKYPSAEALTDQMFADIHTAKEILQRS